MNQEMLDPVEKKFLQTWLLLGLVLPLASMVPFLYMQVWRLIDQPSFLFFPLPIAAGIWLLYRNGHYRPASLRRARLAVFAEWFGMGLAVLGIYMVSPWIVQVASVVVTFAWSLGAFGGAKWTRVLAICSLFAVAVPLPSGWDMRITSGLQTISSWACSGVLDAIGVPNIIEGNVLQIQDKKTVVSEVCNGVDSFYALMAIGLAVVVFRRCSLLVSLVTLATIPLCSVLGNVVRLLAIGIGFSCCGSDLSTGWGYITTAILVFGLSLACVLLLHVSIVAILAPMTVGEEANNLTQLHQWATTWPQASESQVTFDRTWSEMDSQTARWRSIYVSLGLPSLVCVVFGAISAFAVFSVLEENNVSLTVIGEDQAAAFPSHDAFPEQFGSLKKISFSPITQVATNALGRYSHLWKFEDRGNHVFASLDFPFLGWRPLWTSYQSSGWKIIEIKPVEIPAELGSWTVEEFKMQNQYGLFGFVWYAFFDENGVPIERKNESVGTSRITIFKKLQKKTSEDVPICFQVQLFFESGRELSEPEIERNRQLFFEVFERVRHQSETALTKAK